MVEELDPQKYHIFSKKQIKLMSLLVVLILMLLIPPALYFYYKFAVFRPSQTSNEVTFEIKSGSSVSEIANELEKQKAINSDSLFTFYVLLNGMDKNIQAGVYTIPAGSSIVDIAEMVQHGVNDIVVTFLEGWRVEEYAREASTKFEKIDYRKFVALGTPYEGYLFPDTYQFNKEVQEEEMINELSRTFNEKTQDILTDENLRKAGLTKEEAVIFASIVEREVHTELDRPLVAGILIKRWKNGMQLDADATTQYAVAINDLCPPENKNVCVPTFEEIEKFEWWPKELTVENLEYESPYNTRNTTGLPPAPISSVSQSALKAVLNYKESNYWYYLTDPSGVAHYSETIEEHNQNIAEFL